jgi:PAS domain S-box-containing protein
MKPSIFAWSEPFRSKEYFDHTWMSSTYAVREIEKFFKALSPSKYSFKDAAINARSPENEADEYERAFIEKMAMDNKLESESTIRTIDGAPYLIVMRKGEVMEASCLKCHSNAKNAPKGLTDYYGLERSFNRKAGDVVSAVSLRIPLAEVYASANIFSWKLSAMLMIVLACLFTIQYWLYRRYLLQPLSFIRDKANEIATHEGHLGDQILQPFGRELGELATTFNEMSVKLLQDRGHLEELVDQRTEALRESELRFRELFNHMSSGVSVFEAIDNGRDFIFRDFNPAAEKIEKVSRKDILGKRVTEAYPEVKAFGVFEVFQRVWQTGKPEYFPEKMYKDARDTGGWRENWVFKLHTGEIVTVYNDITDRKRAEEALQLSNERLVEAQQIAKLGNWEANLTTGELYWSQVIFDIFGFDSQSFKPSVKAFHQAVHPDDKGTVLASEKRSEQTGVHDVVHRIIRPDGEVRFVHELARRYTDEKGELVVLRGMVQDITERKRAEEENRALKERLQRSEKMEALGTLAGGVAHDLNNVLGVIVGYSELVLQSVDQSSPLRHRLENVMNGGLKAAAIVDDLLTLARRGVQGRSIVNINQIVADCNKSPELANLSSHHPSVKIITDLEEDLLNISGSSVHLGKTLYNLISNASEAMPTGGTVAVKTRNQYLDKPLQGYDAIQAGDYVVLSVSDTGEGIADADLRRIFEPFYTKKIMGRSGTGLGLAVVWGTVKDHNGYINVQSELGKGTVFTLYFPVTREEITADAPAAAISEYMGKGETILVVDDVKEQRELATGMLGSLNYNVSSVSSGEEAVAYMKEHEVDLMVLDMIMEPGMDGLDTYQSVLKIRPRQKAIIVSGFSESERVKTAQDIGAGAYVRKPYIKAKLGLAVRKELDRTA